jgi:hypothetical protein
LLSGQTDEVVGAQHGQSEQRRAQPVVGIPAAQIVELEATFHQVDGSLEAPGGPGNSCGLTTSLAARRGCIRLRDAHRSET